MKRLLALGLSLLTAVGLFGCGSEKLPSRDQIPIINRQVAKLETAIRSRDRAKIDSLLSVDILDRHQDSDSLMTFIFGADGSFPFYRLGDCEVFYSQKFAVVNCHLLDSAEQGDRLIKLVFKPVDDTLWLLSEFAPGEEAEDSTEASQ